MNRMRVGIGYDVHRLVGGRDLFIGGVRVPSDIGLYGHSDADVLLHAVIDALLGAAALGDIGTHFPNDDARWSGADSRDLLRRTREALEEAGYRVRNVDATVALEKPRLAPHVPRMRAAIAEDLHVDATCISVKATTGEGMGFIGRSEGAAAWATCSIEHLT